MQRGFQAVAAETGSIRGLWPVASRNLTRPARAIVVVAVLTSASTRWNEWAGGGFASFTFPIVVNDLQKYLTGGNEESNRTIGSQ